MAETNVIAALARVMDEMPGIGKDQRASAQQGGYAYRGIEQITRELQPLLARHGVVFSPHRVEWRPVRDLIVNNKPWTDEGVLVTYRVYGPGGIEDFIEVTVPGLGRDNSDKGTNKALTQAFKYALIQTLCISDPREDNDGTIHEADEPGLGYEPAPKDAIDALRARVQALDPEVAETFAAWKDDQGFPWPWPTAAVDAMNTKLDETATYVMPPPPGDGEATCVACGKPFKASGRDAHSPAAPKYHVACEPFRDTVER